MTVMLFFQLVVLLGAIFFGARLGGLSIGYMGGLGVVLLALLLGVPPGKIPYDVILIIMSVIAAISAMQLAGGLDYLVGVAERLLRKNPKNINFLAPTVTYLLTLLAVPKVQTPLVAIEFVGGVVANRDYRIARECGGGVYERPARTLGHQLSEAALDLDCDHICSLHTGIIAGEPVLAAGFVGR